MLDNKMETEYKITECKDLKQITTNAGTFHVPLELYNHYFSWARPKQEDFSYTFKRILERATNPSSVAAQLDNKREYTVDLDEKVRDLVGANGINPADFYSEKRNSSELWNFITPEILDLMARNNLFYHFSSKPDRYTLSEHLCMASSHKSFLGNPFTGGYSPNEKVCQETREKRSIEVLREPFFVGFVLLSNKKDYVPNNGELYRDLTYSRKVLERLDQTLAREVLSPIYEKSREASSPMDLQDVDYVRVLMKPVQYDKNMVAIPRPFSLEFLANKEVVAKNNDSHLLSLIQFRKSDLKLADTIEGSDGKKHYVTMRNKGSNHFLKEIPETPSWFESFYNRVLSELNKKGLFNNDI